MIKSGYRSFLYPDKRIGDIMKNIKRSISVTLLVLLLLSIFSYTCSAVTYFEQDGFYYSQSSATTADLQGRSSEDADLVIPKEFSEVYVTNIADSAFEGDENIETLSFGKAILLERIGFYAFKGCINLSSDVSFAGRISTIGTSAFENCTSLKTVIFNAYVKSIPDQCFYNCSSLENVTLNDRIESIEKFAFANTNLKEITIPKSVTSINSTAFNGCDGLVIKGYRDSYAQQFAEDNGYNFEILDPLYGDANSDGIINILDVTAIQKYKIGEQDLSDYGMKCADVNHDGSVTIRDATLIQMKLAKYDVDF